MDNQLLLEIANNSIKSRFDSTINMDLNKLMEEHTFLAEKGATFVTLTLNDELRGCIGTLEAKFTLLEDLISNSFNAAFNDPRFLELTKDEFENVKLEISVLTKPIQIQYNSIKELEEKIKPNVHGVILEKGNKRSTFLPQVWEQLPTFEEFFEHLCYKGSFEDNFLESCPNVYVYEVNKVR